MSGNDATLFNESFTVTGMDHNKYDRVGRITAGTSDSTINITLDVNTDLFPLQPGDNVSMCLASTLNLDGTKDDFEGKGWRDLSTGEATLADLWQYVCFGRIYRFEEGDANQPEKLKVYVSFGGLLLYIEGPYKKLTALRIDHVYLLLKK